MTANIVRWVPTGMQRMELRADAPAGAEVWIQDETKFFAIAYSGKRAKHDWYYSFRSRERMIAEIEQWIDGLVRSAANKAAAKAEKQNLARQPHGVTVGDVFRAS